MILKLGEHAQGKKLMKINKKHDSQAGGTRLGQKINKD
jgi:hypothetical protein